MAAIVSQYQLTLDRFCCAMTSQSQFADTFLYLCLYYHKHFVIYYKIKRTSPGDRFAISCLCSHSTVMRLFPFLATWDIVTSFDIKLL